MPQKPIRVFYSPLTGRFYASRVYKEYMDGSVVIMDNNKSDVTNDIAAAVVKYGLTFAKETPDAP